MGKCLCNLGKEVEISSGEGGGCIDDGPDAWAVGSAKDGSKLDDDVGEVRVNFDGESAARRSFSGGKDCAMS